MNKNEKIVLDNLLNRINEVSYPSLEKMFNRPISELNEEHISVLLTLFTNEINNNVIASDNLAAEILRYSDFATDIEIDYNLMQLELNNYNIRELDNFVKTQIDLLNEPSTNSPKKKTKTK